MGIVKFWRRRQLVMMNKNLRELMVKIYNKIGFYSAIFICLLLSLNVMAKDAADDLIQLLQKATTMQADFSQFAVNKEGKEVGKHTVGKMALERPGKFYWKTDYPSAQIIIANHDVIWLYDVDLAQATKSKIDYKQAGNPAMLLSGTDESLKQSFNVVKIDMPGVGVWFALRPKMQNNFYKIIRLHFVDDQLVAMYIINNLGQNSEVQFENIILNQKFFAKLFEFSPPKGVDVINNAPLN